MLYTYEKAVEYIEEIPKFTTKNKLEYTKECLRRLGNPEKDKKIIHVAGTNGKGSVCAFLSSMLGAGGYRTGLFISPHLVTINERFQINEVPVSDETFLQAFKTIKALADELTREGDYHPTYFEFLFLMGMILFQEADVDYILLETGIGGRLDATNSIEYPIACVITSISLDHMEHLGNTVSEIAGEKAGIIKPVIPVICDGNSPDAVKVVKARAKEMRSPYYQIQEENCRILKNTADGIDFSFKCAYYGDMTLCIPFPAKYQVMNAALAMETMGVLHNVHKIPEEKLQIGMKQTKWQGRMETILPDIIVDGAHNQDGLKRFVETAKYFQKEHLVTLLFSAAADKDYEHMIQVICEQLTLISVVTTQIKGGRSAAAEKLAVIFKKNGCQNVYAEQNAEQAFEKACELKKDGLLFCVGSLYLIGEIKDYIRRKVHDQLR